VQKFLATETAANASTKRAPHNGDDSSMVTDVAATVSSKSYCPSNDKDDSNSESSFYNSQYNDFDPPSNNAEGGYLCFGLPPSSKDMDVYVIKFGPLSEDGSSTLASVLDTPDAPPVQTLYGNDHCKEFPPMSLLDANMDLTALEMASLELLTLCDDFGACLGLYNDLLALLHWFHKQKVDITKAKARHLTV
jgi:hypothetical protein